MVASKSGAARRLARKNANKKVTTAAASATATATAPAPATLDGPKNADCGDIVTDGKSSCARVAAAAVSLQISEILRVRDNEAVDRLQEFLGSEAVTNKFAVGVDIETVTKADNESGSENFINFDSADEGSRSEDELSDSNNNAEEEEEEDFDFDANGENQENLDHDHRDIESAGSRKPAKSDKKRAQRLTVAELKQLMERPDAVEWVDVCASDPKLLVEIKSQRSVVPVPVHWSIKRKYLQNKRGIEKPPFILPKYIYETGILEMRESVDKEGATLKQKTRERVQPRMNKLMMDYAKLHDAFFKWQTKPELSTFGQVYYEGREYETKMRGLKPGAELSQQLRDALGIGPLAPPPWLFNMQRLGPPPSYPGLRIPGLNAPIPLGAQWGFHPGGWGKPPVDEYGRPLYGDVLGTVYDNTYLHPLAVPIKRNLWGELPPDPELPSQDNANNNPSENSEVEDDGDGDDDDNENEDDEEYKKEGNGVKGRGFSARGVGTEYDDQEEEDYDGNVRRRVSGYFGSIEADGDDSEFGGGSHAKPRHDIDVEAFISGLETPAEPHDFELRKGGAPRHHK